METAIWLEVQILPHLKRLRKFISLDGDRIFFTPLIKVLTFPVKPQHPLKGKWRKASRGREAPGGWWRWTGVWLLTLAFQRHAEAHCRAVCCRWVTVHPPPRRPSLPTSHHPACTGLAPSHLCPASVQAAWTLTLLLSEARVRTVECSQELMSEFKGRRHVAFQTFYCGNVQNCETRREWIALCSSSSLNDCQCIDSLLSSFTSTPCPLGLFLKQIPGVISFHQQIFQ